MADEHKYDRAIQVLQQHPAVPVPAGLSLDAFVKRAAGVHALAARPGSDSASTKKFLDLVSRMSPDDQTGVPRMPPLSLFTRSDFQGPQRNIEVSDSDPSCVQW